MSMKFQYTCLHDLASGLSPDFSEVDLVLLILHSYGPITQGTLQLEGLHSI